MDTIDMDEVIAQLTREAKAKALRIAGIPKRVAKLLGSVEESKPVLAVREFMASPRTLLVLAGGTGCGKTVAACVGLDSAVVVESGTLRKVGRFTKAIDLVRAGTFDGEFWDELTDVSMLVVDDLGTEPLDEKGWALANIAALIDQRYDACRKTILTTNLDAARFRARYCNDGGRLADRIREAGAFLEFDGGSLRSRPL